MTAQALKNRKSGGGGIYFLFPSEEFETMFFEVFPMFRHYSNTFQVILYRNGVRIK